jgi:deoxyribodipyrimidine photolyase-related protein
LLQRRGFEVIYHTLEQDRLTYIERLTHTVKSRETRELVHFEIEDRFFDVMIASFCKEHGLARRILPSPMFLTPLDDLKRQLAGRGSARMADFYRWQRKRLNILVDDDAQPIGGEWSFDEENRKKLPRDEIVPVPLTATPTAHVRDVSAMVMRLFKNHPGNVGTFAWPTTRAEAVTWLHEFVENRLDRFGPYEDAISRRERAIFHSRLSPLLNCGLLTPAEVVDAALSRQDHVPLASLEGFVRQIIGWREFIRGIDMVHGARQSEGNSWNNHRRLAPCWWTGETGIPMLDDMIESLEETGWTHHILRLMVAGNLMNLCEVHPVEAWRWFMEMFVDSAEWVMGPNVYGMGLRSDGGVFATKPYICGSNYLLKMSDYPKGEWCDGVDGLYWGFVARHRETLIRNHRMANIVRGYERLSTDRRRIIGEAAATMKERLTRAA